MTEATRVQRSVGILVACLAFAAVLVIFLVARADAHSSVSNFHSYTTADFHADTNGLTCSTGYVPRSVANNKRWDSGQHWVKVKIKDFYSGQYRTTFAAFTNQKFGISANNAASSTKASRGSSLVGGIHTFWDLVYPRYLHEYQMVCA